MAFQDWLSNLTEWIVVQSLQQVSISTLKQETSNFNCIVWLIMMGLCTPSKHLIVLIHSQKSVMYSRTGVGGFQKPWRLHSIKKRNGSKENIQITGIMSIVFFLGKQLHPMLRITRDIFRKIMDGLPMIRIRSLSKVISTTFGRKTHNKALKPFASLSGTLRRVAAPRPLALR